MSSNSNICVNSGSFLRSTFCRSLEFFYCVAVSSTCPANSSKSWIPSTLNSSLLMVQSSGLSWSATNQTWKCSQGSKLEPTGFGSLLPPGVIVHHVMLSILKTVVLCIGKFFGCFRWELLASCFRWCIHGTLNRLRVNKKTQKKPHVDYLES